MKRRGETAEQTADRNGRAKGGQIATDGALSDQPHAGWILPNGSRSREKPAVGAALVLHVEQAENGPFLTALNRFDRL